MAFGFRKSFKIAPGVKMNVSKSGVGMSAGVPGARIGFNSKGTYSRLSIPKTGAYIHSSHSKNKTQDTEDDNPLFEHREIKTSTNTGLVWILVIGIGWFVLNQIVGGIVLLIALSLYFFYFKKQDLYKNKILLKEAKDAYANENYEVAGKKFIDAYKVYSYDKAIALHAGISLARLSSHKEAARFLQDYLDSHPEDHEILTELARNYELSGNSDKALEVLQSKSADLPIDASYLILMSEIFNKKGMTDAAITTLKRAPLRKKYLTDDLIEILYKLGIIYEETGKKKQARSTFERIYAHDASYKDVAQRLSE